MRYFFTADTHFQHANIIKYTGRTLFMTKKDLEIYNSLIGKSREEQRKFIISKQSLDNMNNALIRNINERVKVGDFLFFLGDFCFKSGSGRGEGENTKASYWQNLINCRNICYIKGNHDKKSNSLNTIIERVVIGIGNKRINLVHNPEHADFNYSINFCGHVHNLWQFKRIRRAFLFTDIINTGVDVNKFYPQTFDELMKKYHRWLKENNYV